MSETMYRVDTENWTVVEVACPKGTRYLEHDGDGRTIYENTHFLRERDAVNRLRSEAEAGVSLAASRVVQMRAGLAKAEHDAADAAVALARAVELWKNVAQRG